MLAYCLDKNIDSQKLLRDIQNLINSYTKQPQDSLILTVRIIKVEQDTTEHIPKLEHKTS
jgi:hypothetical protein